MKILIWFKNFCEITPEIPIQRLTVTLLYDETLAMIKPKEYWPQSDLLRC